jgi:hypothetical protein
MKKLLIATLAAVALLGFAGSSFALLCASDPVPAGTLLYPFVTGRFAGNSTASNPVADRTAPTTLFAVTNVSDSAKIVHFVLWNDFSYPLLDWDALLTGYDVYTVNFADVMEGYLRPTGPATNPATGRAYSPTGTQPIAQGPVPSFFTGIPNLPPPQGVGTTANNTASIFGLCTNPTYTTPFTINPGNLASRIPEFNRQLVYNGLRKSQVISENAWWGNYAPYYVLPDWLAARNTDENVWGYITADVAIACGTGIPSDTGYFTGEATNVTTNYYANNPATNYWVDAGNTLIGDWFIIGTADNIAEGNNAVHIEVDNQNILNSVSYPKAVQNGASFYRYTSPMCGPSGLADDLLECLDRFTGSGIGQDFTTGADYEFGPSNTLPTNDFREPLPSAFAFRWIESGAFDGGTKMRVWKEFPDTYPYYGYTYIYSFFQYEYFAWDEEEKVNVSNVICPVSPCPTVPGEVNQLPLEVQEVDVDVLNLPTSNMQSGWILLAFVGSNTYLLPVTGGYTGPFPNTYGTQAWVEVAYVANDRFSADFSAAIIGNFLCDGLAVAADPYNGYDVTDLGDVQY